MGPPTAAMAARTARVRPAAESSERIRTGDMRFPRQCDLAEGKERRTPEEAASWQGWKTLAGNGSAFCGSSIGSSGLNPNGSSRLFRRDDLRMHPNLIRALEL